MGKLTLLGSKGDERVKWTADDKESVKKARKQFDKLVKEGWNAFKVDPDDPEKKGERITSFDEALGEIVMVRPLAGG